MSTPSLSPASLGSHLDDEMWQNILLNANKLYVRTDPLRPNIRLSKDYMSPRYLIQIWPHQLKCKNNCGTYRHLIRLSLKINKIKIVFVLVLWFSLYKKQILYCVKVKVSILLPTLTNKATRTFSHTQDSNPRLQRECLTHRTNHLLSWTFLALWSPDF